MPDTYDEEVVSRETATGRPVGEPVPPLAPMAASRTSVTSYRRGVYQDRVSAAIWWIVGLIDILIAIRFILKLFGASTASAFTQFMYSITDGLVAPFHGIFNTAASGRSVLEPESLVAMAIYTLIGWGIISLIHLLARPSRTTTVVE
ncbi:MAG TPA: TetR-like C-terminal domain-containing protein [Candidatus Limnocylindrales bacterium]|nr:TetR-like C-terminal domain-containing protein [Candidatus Limnocylindrales bacterium]